MRLELRKVHSEELDAVKKLFDQHRVELGFVLRPSLQKSISDGELIGAFAEQTLVGAVHYHHRRDGQTTLYHIAVHAEQRKQGIGKALVNALQEECTKRGAKFILLKCPTELPANTFYAHSGFQHKETETGKRRPLNVWWIEFKSP